MPVARLPSGGCVSEGQRREDRGAAGAEGVGAGGGVPSRWERGLGRGLSRLCLSPEIF